MSQQYLDKGGLSYFWSKIKSLFIKGNVGGIFYGTCDTAGATVAKQVDCEAFTADDLKAGTTVWVKFKNLNSGAVGSLTLNVNGSGAKSIKYINNGSLGNVSSAGYFKANTTYPFTYDGTYWVTAFNYNTTYSAMNETEMYAGTATSGRVLTAVRLKQAVEYHAPVKSVNGNTGEVTVAVPTKTSDLTNDSGFITSAPVTSVNGQTGAVTISVPTETSELTNDGDGENPFVTRDILSDYVQTAGLADILATPKFYACDSTTKAVLQQAFGISVDICVPEGVISQEFLLYFLEPRTWFAWMNGSELEFARLSVRVDTGTGAITLYLKGKSSIASGIMGVDSAWTVTSLTRGQVSASSSKSFTLTTGKYYKVITVAVPASLKGDYIVAVSSTGTVSYAPVRSASDLTISATTNTLTIANGNTSYAVIIKIEEI